MLAMAFAAFAAPAMAQSTMVGNGGVDILGQGIFETGGSAFKFPAAADTNFDSIDVGNDRALAIGVGVGQLGILNTNIAQVTAQNNLKIKKNQDSGACDSCCKEGNAECALCQDACTKYNVEQVKVGDRNAVAIGAGFGQIGIISTNTVSTLAQNNVEIVTNQQ